MTSRAIIADSAAATRSPYIFSEARGVGAGKSVRGLCISLGGFIMSKLDNYIYLVRCLFIGSWIYISI